MATFIYPPYQVTVDTGQLATAAKQDEQTAILQQIEDNTDGLETALADVNSELDAHTALLTTIDSDTGNIASNTAAILSDTTAILSDTTAILADTSNIDTNVAAILADTSNIDTTTVAILADTTAILADTSSIDTNVAAILADTSNIETSVASIDSKLTTTNSSLASIESALSLDVVDQIDSTPLLDTSGSNIPGSASNPLQIVASTAADIKKVISVEDIGSFIGLYTGAALSEVLKCVLPLGGGEVELIIPAGTRLSLRAMETPAISSGKIALNFLG